VYFGITDEQVSATDTNATRLDAVGYIDEGAQAAVASVLVRAVLFVNLLETLRATDLLSARFLWDAVSDNQTPDWQNVTDSQTPGWVDVNDAQVDNWQNVADSQSTGWVDVADAQTPTWQEVET